MEQLELRFYPREEIADALSVKITSHNFKRDVENTLSKWGYGYNYLNRRGVEILSKPDTPKEKLAEIIYRGLGIDIQTNPLQFAFFITAFTDIEGFACQPWAQRVEEYYKRYGVLVSDRTLRNWCHQLIEQGAIAVMGGEYSAWRTYVDSKSSRRIREPIEEIDKTEMEDYYNRRSEIFAEKFAELRNSEKDEREARKQAWSETYSQLWSEYECCFYWCKTFSLSAFSNSKVDLREIYELARELADENESPKEEQITPKLQSDEFVF